MSEYPTSYYTPRTVEDRSGVPYVADKTKVFYAKDHNDLAGEVVAIQHILGLSPEGDFSSVVDRLDDIDDQLSELEQTGGWTALDTIPTLIDTEAPNYILRFGVDMTGILQAGQRLKITQNGSLKYFIIQSVGVYESGHTDIIVYGGTDYSVENTTTYPITLSSYSGEKAPFGFSLDPDKWKEEVIYTSNQTKGSSLSADTWYNVGSASITLPVGKWYVSYNVQAMGLLSSNQSTSRIYTTLSSSNNSESNSKLTSRFSLYLTSNYVSRIYGTMFKSYPLELEEETDYYLNTKVAHACDDVYYYGSNAFPTIISAVNAYL